MSQVPVWQPDEEAAECPICHQNFTLFFRRHHCRKCGRVVCGSCSSTEATYLATTYVVCPPQQVYLESPHVPHRTCDECVEELALIQRALPESLPTRELMVQHVSHIDEGLTRCPVCDKLLINMSETQQEAHVDACLRGQAGSPGSNGAHNRMIIYRLNPKEAGALGECTVCFEDFETNSMVGRLECLCVFHEKCILSWFTRKGAGKCPVHSQ